MAAVAAVAGAGTTFQEHEMGKGNRGNKEAKKPKQAKADVKAPTTATSTPPVPTAFKPTLQKK